MEKTEPHKPERQASVQGRVLLLADDGRMASLLRERLEDYEVEEQASVLEGIRCLGERRFDAALVNIERLGQKTAEAVRALLKQARDGLESRGGASSGT